MIRTYSTAQVARMVSIHRITLHLWLKAGKVRPPHVVTLNGGKVYIWTPNDVERVRRYKASHYWEGRGGRKPKGGTRAKSSRNPRRR